jgi:hypothetical protein
VNVDRSRLRLYAIITTAAFAGSLLIVLLGELVLRTIANIVWALVLTPGGIIALALAWKWMSLQEARARGRKKS